MNLYEAMKICKDQTIDTCDTIYDCIVTVDKIEKATDNYYTFCVELQKKVDFERFFNGAFASAIVDWTGFLKKNKSIFENLVKETWIEPKQYVLNDEEEFYCEWIEQLHLLLAGYGTEGTYKKLVKMLKDCK